MGTVSIAAVIDGDTVQGGTSRTMSGVRGPLFSPGAHSEDGARAAVSPALGPALLLPLWGPRSLLFSECQIHVCHPGSPPGHWPAVTLGDIKGLTELREAQPQPAPPSQWGFQALQSGHDPGRDTESIPHPCPSLVPAVLSGR